MNRARTILPLVMALLGAVPIQSASTEQHPADAQPAQPKSLQGGAQSTDELVARLLRALKDRNVDALRGLRVNEQEFRSIIIPGSSKVGEPPRQLSEDWTDYEWDSVNFRSAEMEQGMIRGLGGKELTLKESAFDGGLKPFSGYTAHSQLRLELVDADGKALELETGSIAEVNGRYKFIAFFRD